MGNIMQIDLNQLRSWKEDPTPRLIIAGLAVVFIGWRLVGNGMHGKEDILSAIEAAYVQDYRYHFRKCIRGRSYSKLEFSGRRDHQF